MRRIIVGLLTVALLLAASPVLADEPAGSCPSDKWTMLEEGVDYRPGDNVHTEMDQRGNGDGFVCLLKHDNGTSPIVDNHRPTWTLIH